MADKAPITISEQPSKGTSYGGLDWFELRQAVCSAVEWLDPPAAHWLESDCGISYCRKCAIVARGHEFELGPLLVESDWHRRDDWEQAFFEGIGANPHRQPSETDITETCYLCGVTLDYWLTDYGIKAELDHWASAKMSENWSEIAYNIDRLFECDDEQKPHVRALAERFLTAKRKPSNG